MTSLNHNELIREIRIVPCFDKIAYIVYNNTLIVLLMAFVL